MALESYPVHSVLIHPARQGGYYADNHLREGFIKGYEQAEKDTIERAVEYIKSTKIFGRCFPEDFRKAMEEE